MTLHLRAEGTRDDTGTYTPGPTTDIEVWAAVADGGQTDVFIGGFIEVVTLADVTIRWRQDVADHDIDRLSFTFDGRRYDGETSSTFADRRRTIVIRGREFRSES